MSEHIRDLDARGELPVVGRYYWVECVRVGDWGDWFPTFGPPHRDADLGVRATHVHNDVRCLSDRAIERSYGGGQVAAHERALVQFSALDTYPEVVSERKTRRLLCHRQTAPPFIAYANLREDALALFRRMQARNRGRVLGDTCPHRAFPRSCMPIIEHEGRRVRVCPGHGLRFDAETGELVEQ